MTRPTPRMSDSFARQAYRKERCVFAKRLAVLSAAVVGVVLIFGVVQAGAAGPTKVLKFEDTPGTFTPIGFNPNTLPPVGSRYVITVRLKNDGVQFGKPSGATVGRVLVECTVLAIVTAETADGNCFGIAHVPDGFFTFQGNGPLTNAKVNYWAITGGIGPYANARGQIKVTNHADGTSAAVVSLYS